ncbi:MAG: PASTA domain-containing protein [Verrucomicrobiales bacterium]|nr:PASTA domain-containing protein [Verrucomicrobiales bacterium]
MKKPTSLCESLRNPLAWLLFVSAVATHQTARANQVFGSDGSFGFKDTFFDNQAVYASGEADFNTGEFIFPQGNVCVVAAGIGFGQAISDVTAGGCNLVVGTGIGGAFFDEPVWLPPLTPGTYDLVLDDNRNGVYDVTDAKSTITVLPSGGAPPTINVANLKAQAGEQADQWEAVAFHGRHLSDYASAIALGWAVATGDVVTGVANAVSLGASLVFGVDIPLDYNAAVLIVGGKVIDRLAGPQAQKYADLRDDPPDPLFMDFAAIDIGAINADLAALAPLYPAVPQEYPFNSLSDDALHLAQVTLANAMAQEAALVVAFRRSLEKFQGAEAAANDEFTFLQARAVKKYADLLAVQLAATRQAVLDYKAELAADGLDTVSYDGAQIAALIDRLLTTGLTPDEEQNLREIGFTDADFTFLLNRISAFPAPVSIFTRGETLDDLIGSIDSTLPAVQDVADQAQDVMDALQGSVTPQHPTANPGGPYSGDEGVAINFDASASSDPTGQSLTYEWDFDLDGEFDDAVGASVSTTYNAPFSGKLGLKVTDPDGNSDIAYASVQIADVNSPPEIVAFAPVDLAPTASNLSPLDFSATAVDPETEPLSYEWRLDGAVMSSASAWTYTPGAGETGTRTVLLTVSDSSPLSEDAIELRLVRLIDEVLTPDVVGLSQAAAEAAITSARLAVGIVDTANSDTVPAGAVISQTPLAGTVALAGSTVNITVSLGPEPVVVPDVVGLEQAAAEAAILSANLTVGAVSTANSDTVPAGKVIEQNPLAGSSVPPETAVDLVISEGPAHEPPPAPQNLTARAKLLHVNLRWNGSAEATGYVVFRRLNSEADFAQLGKTARTALVDDLPVNTTFAEYYVVAESEFGMSGPSAIVMVSAARR